jgi:alpha-L-fucosidase
MENHSYAEHKTLKRRSRMITQKFYGRSVMVIVALSLAVIPLIPFKVSALWQDSVWVVTFAPGDALETKLKKAAHVRPSPVQTKWMERETIAFMHYGMNTFHGSDWGTGNENPKDFAPMQQNTDQWVQAIKDTKLNMVVPTVKHHDGFCIWNTATTEHCIRNATVTTDVFDALHKSCVKYGVDLGFYLSPWDMNQDAKGVWRDSVAYNRFFVNQLKELMTNYGPIGECWFDGAVAPWIYPIFALVPQYRPNMWHDTIEAYQPNAVIRMYDPIYYSGTPTDSSEWMGIKQGTKKLKWRGKEVRTCGNESGAGRADEWCVQPVFTRFFAAELRNSDLGQESYYPNSVGAVWYQSEVNTSVAIDWHWHSQSYQLKSLSELKTVYYNSVGDDAVLLLNVLPDNRGLLPNDQIALLKNWRNWVDSTFTKNWANGATAAATAVNATPQITGHEADKIIDHKRHTYWTTGGTWNINNSTASITFTLPSPQTFDNVMIKEYVYDGQRVAGWNVQYLNGSTWTSLVSGKKIIGYKRICKFNQVTASQVRLNITRSWDNPEISNFALYRTLSGIDLTPEDTTPSVAVMPAATAAVSFPLQPKITLNARCLAIDAMGQRIGRVDIVGLDGRLVPLSIIHGSKAVSRPLTTGVYLVKIQAGVRTYSSKIAVSR